MDITKITTSLTQLFDKGNRLIFWQDVEGEFREMVGSLALEGVTLLDLDELAALEVKARVELEEPESRFLLYATGPQPKSDEDWLLDMRLYGESFAADRSSMILKELGLTQQRLRDHVVARARFFANKDRLMRLKRLVQPDDDEGDIDRKIMAVLLRIDQAEFFPILIALFHALPGHALDGLPPEWGELEKYGVTEPFWALAAEALGYEEATPSLANLLIRLMVTDFGQTAGGLPHGLAHLRLPAQRAANAVLCLGQWRDSASRCESFDALSAAVADALKLKDQLAGFEPEALREVKTFLLVEKFIVSQLRDRIIHNADSLQLDEIRDLASRRQDGYWANRNLNSTEQAPREVLASIYDALIAAAELFDLMNQRADGFGYGAAAAFYADYCRELYRFDQCYRHFCEAADRAEAKGWDILKTLRAEVESGYGNGYLRNLALKWGEWLEQGLLAQWKIEGVDNQYDFYRRQVAPVLKKSGDRRVFVIISDAFRYECAQELTEQLNGQYRFSAELDSQLGVLPSYTALGMAALLPHKALSYSGSDVLADGQSTSGLENRSKILASEQGVAIKAEAFMAMKKEEGREFIKPYRVVYVYHDQVDAIGDVSRTEDDTFSAVRRAINDLGALVNKAINSLNGTYLLVTADHGFLFQESPPTDTEKNAISSKPAGAVVAKKRYIIGKGFSEHPKAYRGETDVTAETEEGMAFWVPKGINRFHFVGGARFVHGGAMPQEVVVPVIRVQQIKGKQAEKTRTRTVGVSVLGHGLKITTNRYKVRLIQTEAVSERVRPLTTRLAIYEGAEPVTNVEAVTFDSASSDMNEWRRDVWLTLASRTFSNKTSYHLILRNAETDVEEARIEVSIDLAFTNDF